MFKKFVIDLIIFNKKNLPNQQHLEEDLTSHHHRHWQQVFQDFSTPAPLVAIHFFGTAAERAELHLE